MIGARARDRACCSSSCGNWSTTLVVAHGDPVLAARRGGAHVLHRPHAQHPLDDGPDARGRHAGGQRGRGAREHLPAPPARARRRCAPRCAARARCCRPWSCSTAHLDHRVPAAGARRAHRDHHLDRRGRPHHHLHARAARCSCRSPRSRSRIGRVRSAPSPAPQPRAGRAARRRAPARAALDARATAR